MKRFCTYIFVLFPLISFGQLFPKIADFRGDLKMVVEKMYGKDDKNSENKEFTLQHKSFSGEKNIYLFDAESNLISKTKIVDGKVDRIVLFQNEKENGRNIVKEYIAESATGDMGDYLEYVNFHDLSNRIARSEWWMYNSKEKSRILYLVEYDPVYSNGLLMSFVRFGLNELQDTINREKISLRYDVSGNLEKIARKDLSSGLTSEIYLQYDKKGFLNQYSFDFLVEIQQYNKAQPQDVYYKTDRYGNWTRKYLIFNQKYTLQTKRRIRYF